MSKIVDENGFVASDEERNMVTTEEAVAVLEACIEAEKNIEDNPRENSEGYSDPTPYKAIKHIDEKTAGYYRFKNLLRTIWYICNQAGFKVEGRITLVDKKTGRVWR